MKNDVLLNIDKPCQFEKLYRQIKQLLNVHLMFCIPNSITTYHATGMGREVFKSHVEAPEQLVLTNRNGN